jgi:hypothetical protein
MCTCTPTDCTVVGGVRCCNGYDGCGSCMRNIQGIEECQDVGECCTGGSPAAATKTPPKPSWLTTIDFEEVLKQLEPQPSATEMARLLTSRYKKWAETAERCGHITGGNMSVNKVPLKFDTFVTASFMEITLHLGGDQDQHFKIRAGGWWNFIDEGGNQVVGKGGIVKVFPVKRVVNLDKF